MRAKSEIWSCKGSVVMRLPTYVLVTPARNEAQFIESTIQSVMAQTVHPLKWVIVSDGSTDGTDEIVLRYAAQCDWIELIRMPAREERSFAGKAHAFAAGKARLHELNYDVIANLDADITVEEDYFEFLLGKLSNDPKLGVVGTPYIETTGESFDYRFTSVEHVSGACQVFRRECYEAIGGYVPVKLGTIDCIAVITARMKGWSTRTFTGKICRHHRRAGTAQNGATKAHFTTGVMDYAMGNHPLWQICRSVYQCSRRPVMLRGLAIGAGFLWAVMKGVERPVSREFIEFHRHEQMQWLKQKIRFRSASGERALARGASY